MLKKYGMEEALLIHLGEKSLKVKRFVNKNCLNCDLYDSNDAVDWGFNHINHHNQKNHSSDKITVQTISFQPFANILLWDGFRSHQVIPDAAGNPGQIRLSTLLRSAAERNQDNIRHEIQSIKHLTIGLAA